jgi:hypothetical protein
MPAKQAKGADAIAKAIEAYLRVRPQAADTLDGIARWWLSGELQNAPLDEVQLAVDALRQKGMLRATQRSGQILYSVNADFSDNGASGSRQ